MIKNNFSVIALFGILLGANIPVYSSEGLVAGMVMGSVALVTVVKTVKNSATYQTYCQHAERLALEKDKSESPLLYNQELPRQNFGNYAEEKADAFEKSYKKQQEIYNKRLEPVIKKRRSLKIIDGYIDEKI